MPRTRQVAKAKATEAAVRRAKAGSPAPVDAALQLVEALPVPMFVKSRDGRYLGVNRAWEEFFGVSRASFLGKQVKDLYPQHPAIAEKHLEMDGQLWRNPGGQSYEATVTARDGRLRDTIYYKATFSNGSGEVAGLMGAIVDITARKQAEASLLESERRFRRTFELAGSGVAHIGMDRRFLRVNRRLCEILGYAQDELLRLTGRQISHPDDLDVINAQRPRLYAGEIDAVRVEKRHLRKDGSVIWVAFTMVVERDAAGKPQYEIAFFDDITARKQAEAALRESEERFRQLAHHDTLTSLPNRALFYDRLRQTLALAKRNSWTVGVMLADLDHFKRVNDTLGHAAGDMLLLQAAERLAKSARASDTVARLGGDELAVVPNNLSAPEDAAVVAHKIIAEFQAPFQVEGHSLPATLSIGAALYPNDSTDQETLLNNADAAMYRSKEAGRNCFRMFSAAGWPDSRP